MKQVKRNTLVKVHNPGAKQQNFTQFGNYVDASSKEYLENSFHDAKSAARAVANQSEIQKSQSTSMGQGKRMTSKMLTIGSSNKPNKHATVGAGGPAAQQLAQNQINFISNFNIDENGLKGPATNQQNIILLQNSNNAGYIQKQRPHSSFKA